MERSTRDDVAVFVDFENVYVSVREKFDATPNFELIMDRCEDYGRIVIARAYADWYRYPRVTSALFANGVEPMYVPTYYYDRDVGRTGRPIKNSVDIHLCIDAMRTLYSQTNIRKFVLVTGDRDFIPLVNAIRQHGKDVIVIGIGGAASAHLAQSADEFLFYEQIADLKSAAAGRSGEDGRKSDDRRESRERPLRPQQPKAEPALLAVEARVETPESVAAEPVPAEPPRDTPAEIRSPYDTLVDAVKLARQRGFVVNLGSLKVVMRELDSNFHESKVKDANGKGFSKFKDFVKEAERQGRVQIFTNGTVTEVFLAGEDPYRMSQFAEELASEQAVLEIETELEQEAQKVEVEPLAPEAEPAAMEPSEAEPDAELAAAIGVTEEPVSRVFGDREWLVFRSSMSQFAEPVRFAEIFNALRGLRNQEVVELTNNELKELVKQAINRGMLQRTGRGARAYYRLSSQYRIAKPDTAAETPAAETGQPVGEAPEALEVAPGGSQQAPRRRARLYGTLPTSEAAATVADGTASEPVAVQETPVEPSPPPAEPEAAPAQTPRRRARRKPAAASGNGQNGSEETPEGTSDESKTATPTASRGNARRRPATKDQGADASQPQENAEERENGTRKRRRRKKPAGAEDPNPGGEA